MTESRKWPSRREMGRALAIAALVFLGFMTWRSQRDLPPPRRKPPVPHPNAQALASEAMRSRTDAGPARIDRVEVVPLESALRAAIVVADDTGAFLEGCRIIEYQADPTLVELPTPLAKTDVSGLASLDVVRAMRVSIVADGYCSRTMRIEGGHRYDIALHRAFTMRLQATNLYGKPLSGIDVAMSMGGAAEFTRSGLPGTDPKTAVYASKTGVDGTVTFEGLSAGTYSLHPPFSDDYVPVAGNVFPDLRIEVPGVDCTLVLVELCAAVVTCPDDEVVGFRDTGFKRLGRPGGPGGVGWKAARDRLTAKYPGSYVVVWPPRTDTTQPPEITGVPFTKWHGQLAEMTLELRPLSEVIPSVISYGRIPRSPTALSARVRASVEDGDGKRIDLGNRLLVHVNDGPHASDRTRGVARLGEWTEVSPGMSYFVPISGSYYQGMGTEEAMLNAGEDHEIVVRFAAPMRHVKFDVTMEGVPAKLSCIMTSAEGASGQMGSTSLAAEDPGVWMMTGRWRATFFRDACEPLTVEWEVPKESPECRVQLPFVRNAAN